MTDLMTLPPSAAARRLLDRPDADLRALIDNLAASVRFGYGAERESTPP